MAPNPVFQYDFPTEHPSDVKLQGGAHYTDDNTCLRLTATVTDPDGQITPVTMNWGRAIYTKAVPFWNLTTFQTTIKFTVKPKRNDATPADSLVFFMAPYGYGGFPSSPSDGNFGIFDPQSGKAPNVFAVEFDTYSNPWDPDYSPHLGFNLGSRISEVPAKYVPDPSYIGHQVTLTITYAGGVITATVKTDSHPDGYQIKKPYDLSTILPGNAVEVGLGASTGSHVAFHDVFYWDFFSPAPAPN